MVDADQSLSSRVDSLCSIFSSFDFIVKKEEILSSEICCNLPCRLGVYVSCNNLGRGAIEHLIVEEINDHAFNSCLDSLEACILQKSDTVLSIKGRVQIFISMIEGGLCGTGRAFEKGVFDVKHLAYSKAISLIDKLVL